ncbi:MAG: hypothetical protein KDH15_05770 [Rhodocyclaceae bacterium]|nr:hypothetical protein [Rhodocyclaceae bacterium]
MSDPANRPEATAATSVHVSNELIQHYVERAHQLRSEALHEFFSNIWSVGKQATRGLLHRSAPRHDRIAMS